METKKEMNRNEIEKLQYQLQRYKSMGFGPACQSINYKLYKLNRQIHR